MAKIVISPVPHLKGPISLELETDSGRIVDAKVGALGHRRLEMISRGFHMRDLPQLARRICSSSATAHELAAAEAVEQHAQIQVNDHTRIARNILQALEISMHHLDHFYKVCLSSYFALSRIRDYEGADPTLVNVRNRLLALTMSRDTAPFDLKSETDLYLIYDAPTIARVWQNWSRSYDIARTIGRCIALFNGRLPGGVANAAGGFLKVFTTEEIQSIRAALSEIKSFIEDSYLEDVLTVASGPVRALHEQKIGYGVGNFLSFGLYDISRPRNDGLPMKRFIPAGAIFSDNIDEVNPINIKKIEENLKYSWYQGDSNELSDVSLNKTQAYSFIKAVRYQGSPMETGPLARMMIKKDPGFNGIMELIGMWPSFLSRLLAEAYEAQQGIEMALDWTDSLTTEKPTLFSEPPEESNGTGTGLVDGPNGALLSQINVQQGRIAGWRVIDASTWNASPRDNSMLKGPLEQALVGTPAEGPGDLLNVYRVVYSFGICGLCGAH